MPIRPEKLDYLTNALETLWCNGGLNKAMATDLDIFITGDLPDEEPLWQSYTTPITPKVNDLINLSNAILIDADFCEYLNRFLLTLLRTKQYDLLYMFFDKAFISHVCNTVYNSKNAQNYSLMERSFDRFIEAVKFSGVKNVEILPALFDMVNGYEGQLYSRWQRPAKEYLFDFLNQNEEAYLNFLSNNFEKYGLYGLNFLSTKDVIHSVDIALDFYLNDIDNRPIIAQFLQQNNDVSIKAINKMLHNKTIENKQYVDLMLVFVQQKTLNDVFIQIFNTIATDQQKAEILNYIPVPLEPRIKSLAVFIKTVNRFKYDDYLVLNKLLSNYPQVLLSSQDVAPSGSTAFLIDQFKNLYSLKATHELSYFKELLYQNSLDELAKVVYEQFVLNGTPQDVWAIALIASVSSDKNLAEILMTTADLYEGEKGDIVKLLIDITTTTKGENIREVLSNLDKQNINYDKVISFILESVENNKIFSYAEFEVLADGLVPTFNLTNELETTLEINNKQYNLNINKDCVVEINKSQLNGADKDTKTKVYDFQDRIQKEIDKQTQRLKQAFFYNRKWSSVEFENLLSNPILYAISTGVLWAEYSLDKVVRTFKIEDHKKQTVMEVNNISVLNPIIGIFHPLEAPEYNWKAAFEGKFTAFNQLDRQVYSLNSYTPLSSFVARFNGMIVNGKTFVEQLKHLGWVEGQTQKPFGLVSMQKISINYNLLCEIEFCANRLDDLTEITVKELRFYSLNATKYQNDVYKTNKVNAKVLKSLPERYFSDIMYEVAIACKK